MIAVPFHFVIFFCNTTSNQSSYPQHQRSDTLCLQSFSNINMSSTLISIHAIVSHARTHCYNKTMHVGTAGENTILTRISHLFAKYEESGSYPGQIKATV